MYKMIIIDDEYLVRIGIQETIDWNNYDIEIVGTAKNGREGLKMIKELNPDIIISDVKMPIMDGVELLFELKKEPLDATIIMLSGYKDFEYAKSSLENGAHSYLLKPINNDDLIACVCQALEDLKKERINNTKIQSFEKEIPLIKSTILQKLLFGNVDNINEIIKQNNDYKYGIPENGYVCIGQIDKANSIDDKNFVKTSIEKLYDLTIFKLKEKAIAYSSIIFFSHFVILVEAKNDDEVYQIFKEVIDLYDDDLAIVSIVISEKYYGLEDIYDKYASSKKIFKNKMAMALNSVTTYNASYVNYREEITRTLQYISENYKFNISARIVAEKLSISESHLMHILKDDLGKTFNELLTEYRIKIAKILLQDPNTHVYEVGSLVGYNDLKYFRKIFSKLVGSSPAEYRKRIKNEKI